MKTFEEFNNVTEMAVETGINLGSNFSKEDTYNSLHLSDFEVLNKDVGNGKYKILLYKGSSIWTYYFVNTDEIYLGHIEFKKPIMFKDSKCLVVSSSYSTIKGLYGMIFTHILKDSDIDVIFGDTRQSTQAIASWKKIIKSFTGIVFDKNTGILSKYNPSIDYWDDENYHVRVGITADKKILEEHFIYVNERLNDAEDTIFQKLYRTKDIALDMYLYPNSRMQI